VRSWLRPDAQLGFLGTYSAKRDLAYALGYIDDDDVSLLNAIFGIRNLFAHHLLEATFEDEVAPQPGNVEAPHVLRDWTSPLMGRTRSTAGRLRRLRKERLHHFVIFGERNLRHLLVEFIAHYHSERYRQGIGNILIRPQPSRTNDNTTLGPSQCRSRLGGQLNFYLRNAA